MANHKSALKRVAVTAKKNLNNRVITSRVKTAIKSFDKSLEAGDRYHRRLCQRRKHR